MKQASTDSKIPTGYQNNPFFVATDGLDLLFKKAQPVGVALAIVSAIAALSSIPRSFFEGSTAPSGQTAPEASTSIPVELLVTIVAVALVFLLVFTFIGIVLRGISDYTSAQIAKGETTTLRESLSAVFSNFWSYTWMLIISNVKILLWSLLFIIPGIVMSFRYSLAGVSFFDKGLRGNAAITHSSQLVKGAWLTTFASQSLLNIITFGIIQPLLGPGTNAVLYRQLVTSGDQKPKAHTLSWVTIVVGTVLLAAIILLAWGMILFSMTYKTYS